MRHFASGQMNTIWQKKTMLQVCHFSCWMELHLWICCFLSAALRSHQWCKSKLAMPEQFRAHVVCADCKKVRSEHNIFIILFVREWNSPFMCRVCVCGGGGGAYAIFLHVWTSMRLCTDNILMSSPSILRGQSRGYYLQPLARRCKQHWW